MILSGNCRSLRSRVPQRNRRNPLPSLIRDVCLRRTVNPFVVGSSPTRGVPILKQHTTPGALDQLRSRYRIWRLGSTECGMIYRTKLSKAVARSRSFKVRAFSQWVESTIVTLSQRMSMSG